MIEKAYAKINLSLNIKDKREDGYHDLESIMLPIELHDTIDISIEKSQKDDFVVCDDYSVKITKYNLVHRIIDAARKEFGFAEKLSVNIHKNIFLQAGLGGGSADAGAVLRAILKLFKIKVTKEQLIKIGIEIGSDVPWAIFSEPAVLRKKGEVLEFFDHVAPFYILLVKPVDGLSTPEVFAESDKMENELVHGNIDEVLKAYKENDMEGLEKTIFNTLQKPAIALLPEVENVINQLENDGFNCVMMSGAGSCVFGFTTNKKLLKASEKKYALLGYQVEATKFLSEKPSF